MQSSEEEAGIQRKAALHTPQGGNEEIQAILLPVHLAFQGSLELWFIQEAAPSVQSATVL